jgi:sugar/nucleoside kinase (ribokinase family)
VFDVIAIGTATRDVFWKSPVFKTLRDPQHLKPLGFPTGEAECFVLGAKIQISDLTFAIGGGAANAAVTFARQGCKTGGLIAIGDDSTGSDIAAGLKREGIKLLNALNSGTRTAYSTILLPESGERTILYFRDRTGDITAAHIPWRRLRAKWAYIATGTIELDTLRRIVEYLAERGTAIGINPSRHFIEQGMDAAHPVLEKAQVLIMNREEASYFTGITFDQESDIFRKLIGATSGIIVMTEGANGALIADGRSRYRAGIFKEKHVADRTGAGDAFGSGFIAGLVRRGVRCKQGTWGEENIKYALRLAAANATSVVEAVGAYTNALTAEAFERDARWRELSIEIREL